MRLGMGLGLTTTKRASSGGGGNLPTIPIRQEMTSLSVPSYSVGSAKFTFTMLKQARLTHLRYTRYMDSTQSFVIKNSSGTTVATASGTNLTYNAYTAIALNSPLDVEIGEFYTVEWYVGGSAFGTQAAQVETLFDVGKSYYDGARRYDIYAIGFDALVYE